MLRVAGLALLVSVIGWLTVVAPARRARDLARAEYAEARQDRERLRARVAALQRRSARTAADDPTAAGRALRLALLRATEGLAVERVQIGAAGERSAALARGRLSAEGGFSELLRLADRLADGRSGVRIERMSLVQMPQPAAAKRLEVEAVSGVVEAVTARAGS